MLEDMMPKRTKEQNMLSQNDNAISDLTKKRDEKEFNSVDRENISKSDVELSNEGDDHVKSFDIQTKIDDDLVNATVRTESASDYLTRREDKYKKRNFGKGPNEAYSDKKDSSV